MIVGWIVYNFYKAGKKAKDAQKRRASDSPRTNTSPKKDVRSIIEEILSEQTKQASAPIPVPAAPTASGPVSMEEIIDETQYDSEVSYTNENNLKESSELVEGLEGFNEKYNKASESHSVHNNQILIEEENEHENIFSDMDISKAVIYSEILKRPAYVYN